MKRFLTLSRNDFRMVFRDPMLRLFLLLPLLIILAVVWGIPPVFAAYPAVQDYDYVILMWAGTQASTLFGFINGFVFLEEKDEHVFAALRVMPIAASTLIGVRMLLGVSIAFAVNVTTFSLCPWLPMSSVEVLLIALQYSLLAPLLTLALATFAENKVEGLAQFKVYNFIIILPALIYFLPFRALHALAVVPTYWTFRSVEAVHSGEHYFLFIGIGFVAYIVAFVALVRFFEQRVF